MTTLPTPVLLVLLCLAPFGIMALFGMFFVAFLFARFVHEERQRHKRAHKHLFRSIDDYLQNRGKFMAYIECPACKGTTIGADGEECKTCDGTGYIYVKGETNEDSQA